MSLIFLTNEIRLQYFKSKRGVALGLIVLCELINSTGNDLILTIKVQVCIFRKHSGLILVMLK